MPWRASSSARRNSCSSLFGESAGMQSKSTMEAGRPAVCDGHPFQIVLPVSRLARFHPQLLPYRAYLFARRVKGA